MQHQHTVATTICESSVCMLRIKVTPLCCAFSRPARPSVHLVTFLDALPFCFPVLLQALDVDYLMASAHERGILRCHCKHLRAGAHFSATMMHTFVEHTQYRMGLPMFAQHTDNDAKPTCPLQHMCKR